MEMINYLKHCVETQEGMLLYLIATICLFMAIDFVTGSAGAFINPAIKFRSKEGINGILRKLVSIAVMVAMIPLSILIPNDMGLGLLYTLYIGYLILEFKSIIENLDKCGVDVGPLKIFLRGIEENLPHLNDDKNKDNKNKDDKKDDKNKEDKEKEDK